MEKVGQQHGQIEAGGNLASPGTVGICSWQRGFCHGTFNACLAQVAAHAFPGHSIHFHAEKSHLPFLEDVLSLTCPDVSDTLKLTAHDLGTPRTAQGSLRRFRLLFKCVQAMRRNDVACWIFADMGDSALRVLRTLMRLGRVTVPVVVIAHGLFEPLGWNASTRPRDLVGLKGPSTPHLRLVVLGEHIFEALQDPWLQHHHDIRLLPHPVLDLNSPAPANQEPHRFVFPGVPDKGLTSFAGIATTVRGSHPEVQFSVAGFATSADELTKLSSLNHVATAPLSIHDYFRRLSGATYGIWFTMHTPDPYQYRASGTIPDLLACGRPAIFIRNPMVDSYFRRFGSIGYRCDSMQDLVQRVKHLAEDSSREDMLGHQTAVEQARKALLPQSLAPLFREIVLNPKRAPHV